jgi:hypothetical protein
LLNTRAGPVAGRIRGFLVLVHGIVMLELERRRDGRLSELKATPCEPCFC